MSDLQKEYDFYTQNKLTTFDETTGHYTLNPQRSCFVRCDLCENLSQADSYANEEGDWVWCQECLFCIQRVIDLLGFYEHKKAPVFDIHNTPKKRKHRDDPNDIYRLLERAAESGNYDYTSDEPTEG